MIVKVETEIKSAHLTLTPKEVGYLYGLLRLAEDGEVARIRFIPYPSPPSPLMDFANELKNRLGQITKLETL
jgi:hypothetical protein